MLGERTVPQEAPFYEFSLKRHVPAHLLLMLIVGYCYRASNFDRDACSRNEWFTHQCVS